MRVFAGKLLIAALLGGAVTASLSLPRVFDSAQRPLSGYLPVPSGAEAQSIQVPARFLIQPPAARKPRLLVSLVLPQGVRVILPLPASRPVSAPSVLSPLPPAHAPEVQPQPQAPAPDQNSGNGNGNGNGDHGKGNGNDNGKDHAKGH